MPLALEASSTLGQHFAAGNHKCFRSSTVQCQLQSTGASDAKHLFQSVMAVPSIYLTGVSVRAMRGRVSVRAMRGRVSVRAMRMYSHVWH